MKASHPNLIPCIVLSFLSTLSLSLHFLSEQFWGWSYFITTPLKVSLLLLLILSYRRWVNLSGRRRPRPLMSKSFEIPLRGMAFGALGSGLLIFFYSSIGQYIDFSVILQELQTESKIDLVNFIFIACYIALFNSFLEEYFFRGFLLASFKDLGYATFGIHLSAILFAIYHVGIFLRWFEWPIIVLSVFGLYLGGLIFTRINSPSGHILNSWIAHIMLNIAIILIAADAFQWISLGF